MVRWHRARARRVSLVGVVVVLGAWVVSLSGPSVADVTAVQGSAYGYYASVALFQPPPMVRGPEPVVTLPPGGSATPITATIPTASVVFGPATLFTSGPITVSTQGTTGPTGSVTSSANISNVNTSGQEVFTASSVASMCSASEAGVSGSTTINNGTLITSEGDPDIDGDETIVAVPTNPAPNTTFTGTIESVGDNFRYVFNEQFMNADGSITVNAAHMYLLGPTAVGDLILGQVNCGVTAVPSSTTSSTVPPVTTSSTVPPVTTSSTVPPVTTSSTLPPVTTSSTLPPVTTSSTLPPVTTSSTLPPVTTSSTLPPVTTSSTVPPVTTSSTLPPVTTSSTPAPPPPLLSFIMQIICAVLRPLAALPFIGPFIQPLLTLFGCGPA